MSFEPTPSSESLEGVSRELRSHLRRLAYASSASIAVAAGLSAYKVFATTTIAWATVNLLIVFGSWKAKTDSVRKTREFLSFNLGLNLAYLAVGVTLAGLGHVQIGIAISVQAVILEVLDGYLWTRLPKA